MTQHQRLFLALATATIMTASLAVHGSQGQTRPDTAMNDLAERYVKLVLAMGQHDADYVDAYYGPDEWSTEAERAGLSLVEIGAAAEVLITELDQTADGSGPDNRDGPDDMVQLRRQYLGRQLQALQTRVRMLGGRALAFDDESRALYDAVAPSHPEAYFQETVATLETRLPGQGSVVDRYGAFRRAFIVPADRLDQVFDAAIAECRRRTLDHVDLPGS